ncbi:hypothetical protein, partial [Caldifermentibacillus hisashii]|uniref:hypothetical protein n=1 Tax=Caldifermentibacillus hisashii TaxID=996558 RepID=UPI0030E800CB
TQRPLSPHFSVIPVGKIFFSVFSILWESRNNEHRNYLYLYIFIFGIIIIVGFNHFRGDKTWLIMEKF